MQVKGVDFAFYNVTDMKRSVKFYRDTLGLKLIKEFSGGWTEFDAGNLALVLGVYGAKPIKKGQKGNVSVGLAVDDVKKAVAELKKKKVPIHMDVQDFNPCFMAAIGDPDGNEIILHQRKDGTVG